MLALKILGIIVLIILLINAIPIGADIGYENNVFMVSAKFCGILLQILPKEDNASDNKKAKISKKTKKKSDNSINDSEEEKKKKPKKKFDFTYDEIVNFLKVVLKGLGSFFHKFKIDRFLFDYVAAGNDPYKTAQTYNYVNAALSSLYPVCKKRYNVKDSYVHTNIDFTAEETKVDFGIAFSIRIGQIIGFAIKVAFGALIILIKHKLRLIREKRVSKRSTTTETTDNNIDE